MPSKLRDLAAATVQTTDATTTTLLSYTLPDASITQVRAVVVARRPSNGDSAAYSAIASFKRHAAGGATAVGAVTALATHEDGGAAGWSATMDVTGNTFRVRIVGQASATIEWFAYVEVTTYVP